MSYDILTNTGAPIDINALLANPYMSALSTSGWNGNMAVGAPPIQDADLNTLAQLISTSGGMNMAVGSGDIFTETGATLDEFGNLVVGAPMRRAPQAPNMAQLQNLIKGLMAQNQQLKNAVAQAQQAQQASANKLGTRAALVDREPDKYSFMVLPVNSTSAIAAGATVNVQAEPQYHFKPKVLKFPNGGLWQIGDVKVGARSQFAGAGAVPGEIFAENATGIELIGDTATPGQKIYVQVTNLSGVARSFVAALLGHVVS